MKLKKEKQIKNRSILFWLGMVAGKQKWLIGILLIFQAAMGLASVGYAFLLRVMIDGAVAGAKGELLKGGVLLAGLILAQLLMRAVERYLEEYTKASLENRLKSRLFSCLLENEYAKVTAVHSGEWMNRLTSDTVTVTEGMVQILPQAVGMLVRMAAALAAIVVLEPRFGLVIVPGGLLLLLLSALFRKQMKKLHKAIREKDGVLRVYLQERLGSMLVVRAFAMETQTAGDAGVHMEAHKQSRMQRALFSAVCNMGFSGLMQGVYLAGAIYCCFGILKGSITYGTLITILQLISQVQSPMANLTGFMPKYYAMLASAERLKEVEQETESAVKTVKSDQRKSLEEILAFYQSEFASLGLHDVSFTYQPMANLTETAEVSQLHAPVVLKHAGLEICKGEYVAITGQSGGGKSTILKLLMCLYKPEAGECFLRDCSGKQEMLTGIWQRLFAYVPQGNHLMSGTIREIIAFGDKRRMKEEERMWQALKIACADEFVCSLENKLDTQLGERGQGLSEGQMQRIAIARAIFADNPILILDEATSALDPATELQILTHLKEMTEKTVLIVTHRPAALAICEKHVVVEAEGIRLAAAEEGETHE